MRPHTPEQIELIGTIVETYQRSGKHVVTISLEPIRLDLELDGPFDMHLGERVELSLNTTITETKPYLGESERTR